MRQGRPMPRPAGAGLCLTLVGLAGAAGPRRAVAAIALACAAGWFAIAGIHEVGTDPPAGSRPEIEVYPTPSGQGYGYLIAVGGKTVIRQPHVPGRPGTAGFATRDNALRVAELVVGKLRSGRLPPSVTPGELDSLDAESFTAGTTDRRSR